MTATVTGVPITVVTLRRSDRNCAVRVVTLITMVTSITLITMVTVVTLDRFAKSVCRDLQTGATAAGVPLWGSRRS